MVKILLKFRVICFIFLLIVLYETAFQVRRLESIFTFIIYLQKIPLDTTYFPTQKYKTPYHATNVIFSVSPS